MRYKGFSIDAIYTFNNGKLDAIFFDFIGVDDFKAKELEMLFTGVLYELEVELGYAERVDNNWYDDGDEYRLAAYWLNNMKVLWSVQVADELSASILIMGQ